MQMCLLTIGTVCSGTDMPVHVLKKLHDIWMVLFGMSVKFIHIFSCDNNPIAQRFIQRHASPRMIFNEIGELGGDMAFDIMSQMMQPVSTVDMVVGGHRVR